MLNALLISVESRTTDLLLSIAVFTILNQQPDAGGLSHSCRSFDAKSFDSKDARHNGWLFGLPVNSQIFCLLR